MGFRPESNVVALPQEGMLALPCLATLGAAEPNRRCPESSRIHLDHPRPVHHLGH